MSVTTGERHLATGAGRRCPKCASDRVTVEFQAVSSKNPTTDQWTRYERRDRFQCLDCWHVWYEEVK